MPRDADQLLLTVSQAAKLLQVSENHLYNLIGQGSIPHVRLGKLIRIPRWGLLAFIADASGTPIPFETDVDTSSIQSVDGLQPQNEEVQ